MTPSNDSPKADAADVGAEHRKVQREQDAKDRAADGQGESKKPVQAGHVPEPENPMRSPPA